MQQIKLPYGYKSFSIGTIAVFTGKIRIKHNPAYITYQLKDFDEHLLISYSTKTNCSTITFSTTNFIRNQQLIAAINAMLAEIMHKRIDCKYSPTFNREFVEDYLPF